MSERALPFPLPVVPPRFTPQTVAAQNRKLASELYQKFFSWPIEESRKILETTPPEVWEQEGQKRALRIFHEAAERVPAYKDFLRKNGIQSDRIRSAEDFKLIPTTDKKNYLNMYEASDLCWDGLLASTQMTAVSSGSSGKPYFWPRGVLLEIEVTFLFELLLSQLFGKTQRPTLFVNSQSMGMYIGGPFTLNAMLRIAQKGHDLNVTTPGITIDDVIQVISNRSNLYRQLVIAAYPPFAKDIVDLGIERGIKWKEVPDVKFLLFGEGYSENWRDYLSQLIGHSGTPQDFVNCYGTADAAILGHETPSSINLKRAITSKSGLSRSIFNNERTPTLMQYYPTLRYLEIVGEEMALTFGSGGIPLVRYNIHDSGGLIGFTRALDYLRQAGHEQESMLPSLPFVYLFGRSDHTATLYGLNVYPENIKTALIRKDIRGYVTGKFQMSTEYTKLAQKQYILIRVELAPEVKATTKIRAEIRHVIIETLKNVNAEYRKLFESIGRKAVPYITLHPWGDTRYFTVGGKQRWKKKI